jgi:4-phytase/acid phosphatase
MTPITRLLRSSVRLRLFVLASLALAAAMPLARAAGESQGDELKLAVILSRHGVRSPLATPEELGAFSAQAWPKWEVAPGIQTNHGNLLVAYMGDYYRSRYASAGLLAGESTPDSPLVFVRADNDQRTIETGRILGKALTQSGEPDVHAVAGGTEDPLFRPSEAHVGHPDPDRAAAAILGRLGGDARNLDKAYASRLAELKAILNGPGQAPASALDEPTAIGPGRDGELVSIKGPLLPAMRCSDALLLEYAQGMPSSDVGWGRVDARELTELLWLHDLVFDLKQRTPYLAQVQGSNLASHIIDTLEQAALGQPVPGAIGPSGERVVVIVGHDSNIASVGGLLGLNWWIPGTEANPLLPAGALVFELWKHPGATGGFYVKASYVCQTLEQMRQAAPGTPETAPVRAPIFVPGASGAGADFDAPLASFVRHARMVIDPAFITTEP